LPAFWPHERQHGSFGFTEHSFRARGRWKGVPFAFLSCEAKKNWPNSLTEQSFSSVSMKTLRSESGRRKSLRCARRVVSRPVGA
jgi:hypothetical protein